MTSITSTPSRGNAPVSRNRAMRSSGKIVIPSPGRITLPCLINCGTTRRTLSTGHGESDSRVGTRRADDRGVDADEPPVTCRAAVRRELPGLMAASVWMTPRIFRLVTEVIVRPSPLMTPVENVWSRLKGLPIAYAFCPTFRLRDSPIVIGFSLSFGTSIFSTAMSVWGARARRIWPPLSSGRATRRSSDSCWR